MAARRFSQAISEGDGISVLVDVDDVDAARAAQNDGAEAIVVHGSAAVIRAGTDLPILCRTHVSAGEAMRDGADACLLVVGDHEDDDGEQLERLYAEAVGLDLECVVEVRTDEELALALERLDPEIFLLSRGEDEDDALGRALDLLPDVPAGKLAVADVPVSTRDDVVELERAGFDAVIVGARNVAELVGHAAPQV
jgi:indole-3-glycerol phosphate synthase